MRDVAPSASILLARFLDCPVNSFVKAAALLRLRPEVGLAKKKRRRRCCQQVFECLRSIEMRGRPGIDDRFVVVLRDDTNVFAVIVKDFCVIEPDLLVRTNTSGKSSFQEFLCSRLIRLASLTSRCRSLLRFSLQFE
jgi:hypothetical protein